MEQWNPVSSPTALQAIRTADLTQSAVQDGKNDGCSRQVYKPRPGFLGSNWVRFHKMALKQRHFVQEHVM